MTRCHTCGFAIQDPKVVSLTTVRGDIDALLADDCAEEDLVALHFCGCCLVDMCSSSINHFIS